MLDCQIKFQYHQDNVVFQCRRNELMNDIINQYKTKLKSSIDKCCFFYNDEQINPDLNLSQIDNQNKEILILVNPEKNKKIENKTKKSNIIKCLQCDDPGILEFSNDYKINIFGGEYDKKKINLQDFKCTQIINQNEIKCSECSKFIENIYEEKFYYCFECKKNFCPTCKTLHKEHKNIVDYLLKYFKCSQHQDQNFIYYCFNCKKNLCIFCIKQHQTHNTICLNDLFVENGQKQKLITKIQKVKEFVDTIIDSLKKFKDYLDIYVQIYEILNKNNMNLNYENLKSMKNLIESFLVKDIDEILNNNNNNKKLEKIISMCDIMNIITSNETNSINDDDKIIENRTTRNSENSNEIVVKIEQNEFNININNKDDENYVNAKNINFFRKNPENQSVLTDLNKENNQDFSLDNYKFISFAEIMKKYGDNFKDIKLTGEGENTKKIEKNLMGRKESKNFDESKYSEKSGNLLGKKRKNKAKINENTNKIKLGRKKKGDNSGLHTKMKEDNLMSTIKSNYNNWLLNFINIFLPERQKLLKINYLEFTKIINTEENKKYLKMDLCDILSKNISNKYGKKHIKTEKYHNKKMIEKIMQGNNVEAKKILKIKYKDGLDLYRFKENDNENYLKNILGDDIIKNVENRVDDLLIKTYEKEKIKNGIIKADDYVSSLLVMIYNYERWFLLKKPRAYKNYKKEEKLEKNNEKKKCEKKKLINVLIK